MRYIIVEPLTPQVLDGIQRALFEALIRRLHSGGVFGFGGMTKPPPKRSA